MSFHGSQKLNPKNFKPIEMTRVYNGCDCYDWKEIFVFWPVKTVSGKYVFFEKFIKENSGQYGGMGFIWKQKLNMQNCLKY